MKTTVRREDDRVWDDVLIRPIYRQDLDAVAAMCWEDRDTQLRILEKQEILGFGVWDAENTSIGTLHCYRVTLPEWDDSDFPGYGRARLQDWPLGWPLLAAREKGLEFDGPVWGQACFHVGILPNTWQADPRYFRRGIGTALLEASVAWARDRGYAAVIAHGGSPIVPVYNTMMGCLPWTAYQKLGFETQAIEDGARLPWWVASKGQNIQEQVERALAEGKEIPDIAARLMVLRLR
jgi:GNAT superfamily N-acetyltransferase